MANYYNYINKEATTTSTRRLSQGQGGEGSRAQSSPKGKEDGAKEGTSRYHSQPLSRGLYSSLFRYNHIDKKLLLLVDFIKN